MLNVKFSGLVHELYAGHVISAVERDDILAERTSFRTNEKLLSVLSRKSPRQFRLFLGALDSCGQQHVRNVIDDRRPGLSTLLMLLSRKNCNFLKKACNDNIGYISYLSCYGGTALVSYVFSPAIQVCTKSRSERLVITEWHQRAIHIRPTHNLSCGMPYSSMLLHVNLDSLAAHKEDLSRRFSVILWNLLPVFTASFLHPDPPLSPSG